MLNSVFSSIGDCNKYIFVMKFYEIIYIEKISNF